MRTLAGFYTLLVVLLAAPAAYACPMCALNERAGLGSWWVLAGMLGTPFVITGIALVVMRKLGSIGSVAETAEPETPTH